MEISGFIKNSFVDYPGNIACVVFTPGCNFNCWYCHNYNLINETSGQYNSDDIITFLNDRKDFIDGVVITGGEPTLQKDLPDFIKIIKKLGYKVKLDTNGTNCEVVKSLVKANLIDYIAMDIKAPINQYSKITHVPDINEIEKTINFIKSSGIDYEFRTTFAPNLTCDDICEIVDYLGNVNCYSLQQYQKPEHIPFDKIAPHTPSEFNLLKDKCEFKVKKFIIRNL